MGCAGGCCVPGCVQLCDVCVPVFLSVDIAGAMRAVESAAVLALQCTVQCNFGGGGQLFVRGPYYLHPLRVDPLYSQPPHGFLGGRA